jgi:hypothetical protein
MRVVKLLGGPLLGAIILLSVPAQSVAWPVMTGVTADNMVVNVRAVKGGGGRAAGRANVNVNQRNNVNVNNRTNVNVNKRTNVNVNAGRNVNVAVRRPVRVWAPRPYYGTIVGGVALGTMIAVTAMGTAPAVPAPNMCWFWADAAQMSGYWDYCQAPY